VSSSVTDEIMKSVNSEIRGSLIEGMDVRSWEKFWRVMKKCCK
jgi:hypothetical protein